MIQEANTGGNLQRVMFRPYQACLCKTVPDDDDKNNEDDDQSGGGRRR
jgi:hypothetical protein